MINLGYDLQAHLRARLVLGVAIARMVFTVRCSS